MIQTWALLVDAYRELNSKKLFWVTLFLSVGIILVLALFGVDDEGITFLKWHQSTGFLAPSVFYRAFVLSGLLIGIWLSWGAVILALISTAGAFPELIEGGAIDLYLSKPISRPRLFLTKYFTSLLFVTIQLTLFSSGAFLVMGLRAHDWRPSLFLAIPLILALFSCVYCFCVFIGIVTRSTIAALLLGILLWLYFSGVQHTHFFLAIYRLGVEKNITRIERDRHNAELQAAKPASTTFDLRQGLARKRIESDSEQLKDLRGYLSWIVPFERFSGLLDAAQPKTHSIVGMLDRYLVPEAETTGDVDQTPRGFTFGVDQRDWDAALVESQQRALHQSPAYVIGTSLGCEAVILLLAGWIFCRRDY